MQQPTDGVGRRPTPPRPVSRASRTARVARSAAAFRAALAGLASRFGSRPAIAVGRLGAPVARALRAVVTPERALPIAVAAIVGVASLLALLPVTPGGAAGAAQGTPISPRLAINGGVRHLDAPADATATPPPDAQKADPSFQPLALPADVTTQPVAEPPVQDAGTVTADGTLITGYAPETTVEDASALIQTYRVKKGDTLSGIASQYRISTMTLWWANKDQMKAITDLHIGEALRIPPVTGLVVTVTAADTLESLAAKYGADPHDIVDANHLIDSTLVVGQVLVIPGAYGAPIATPAPTARPQVAAVSRGSTGAVRSSSGGSASGLAGSYRGGRMSWPVVGGGNYVSQFYHYGHWAIDIAADYGSTVVAASAGRVTFAGWRSNGGGWQVWISHGGNIYTTYNHLSAITVGAGQMVGRGQQVGRIGQSGDATGPHLHFEVWVGPIWDGGQRMNPLNYL